jgi:hypothetical protein
MSENPLINIGELSKPATVLIEKISDAVGGIFEPYQIIRVAKAEAEAKVIEAKAEIEVTDIQRRAFRRFLKEEERKQKNIEEITQKALLKIKDESQPEKIEDDWIANFFDKSRLISDNEMQNLWSRVLAGEANSPGTYSKRTINLLSSLDKSDADLFTRLCSFGWKIHDSDLLPLIYDEQNKIYTDQNIDFVSLNHLESIGLIQFNSPGGISEIGLPTKFSAHYYSRTVSLELPDGDYHTFSVGKVLLTKVGLELEPICNSKPVDDFFEFICEHWKKQNYIKEEAAQETQPPIESE